MKKACALSIILLLSLPGCGGGGGSCKTKSCGRVEKTTFVEEVDSAADMPLAEGEEVASDETVCRYFDQGELGEFVEADYLAQTDDEYAPDQDELSFAHASDYQSSAFKTVYFEFNSSGVKKEQEKVAAQDAQQALDVVAQARARGEEPVIVIEGHACHSAGSPAYNLALSEKRAKAVADLFKKAGVPASNIKIVGLGAEVPAYVNGKAVDGSRQDQWANRRVEVHVINS